MNEVGSNNVWEGAAPAGIQPMLEPEPAMCEGSLFNGPAENTIKAAYHLVKRKRG